MYITKHKYSIERMPEATIGGGVLTFLLSYRNLFVQTKKKKKCLNLCALSSLFSSISHYVMIFFVQPPDTDAWQSL